jgi:hypothetical protein
MVLRSTCGAGPRPLWPGSNDRQKPAVERLGFIISPNVLLHYTLGERKERSPAEPPLRIFAASSLKLIRSTPAALALTRMSNRMNDAPTPDPSRETAGPIDDATVPAGAPAEPAVERSRFSQWLASFGLGELQDPLLTRARPPAPRRPAT